MDSFFLSIEECVQALNLDGRSSSTLVMDGKVINNPKYTYAKAVSDAILIF
jgi:exopolysaccharide biosynthesis protein